MKIVQINGIRGLIMAVFVGICLIAGFVVFPGLVAMELWNKYLVSAYMFPTLTLFQGILIWGMIATIYSIIFKKNAISFKDAKSLSGAELDMIMKKSRLQSKFMEMSNLINPMDTFEKNNNPFENNNLKTNNQNKDEIEEKSSSEMK